MLNATPRRRLGGSLAILQLDMRLIGLDTKRERNYRLG
jgi:hypothetical protein